MKKKYSMHPFHTLFSEFKTLLNKNAKVVITTHTSPDGDAIGSSLGMAHGIQEIVGNVECIIPNAAPTFLTWMKGYDTMHVADKNDEKIKDLFSEANIWIVLDYNADHRAGEVVKEQSAHFKGIKLVIDHHEQPDIKNNFLYSVPEVGSTAQLVYDFLKHVNPDGLSTIANECLYTGIITDTGSFRFESVDKHTHEIAAEMIDGGLKHWEIHQRIYDQNSVDRLRILGYCLSEKLEILKDGKVAMISLSMEEMQKYKATKGDTEGLVNWALSIQGVEMAAFIKEAEDMVKMSFRSKRYFEVNEFSGQNFSGGGHKRAAGGKSDLPLSETLDRFRNLIDNLEI